MIAAGPNRDGRKVLYLGLSEINLTRLRADMPIYKNLDTQGVPGLEGWDVCILGPEDMARFIARTGAAL